MMMMMMNHHHDKDDGDEENVKSTFLCLKIFQILPNNPSINSDPEPTGRGEIISSKQNNELFLKLG